MRVVITPDSATLPPIIMVDGSKQNNTPERAFTVALDPHPLEGWYEPPQIKDVGDTDNHTGNGGFMPSNLWLSQRNVTVTGHTVRNPLTTATSVLQDARFKDHLAALVGVPVTLRVEDASGARESYGYVSGQPIIGDSDEYFGVIRFSLTMTFPDPLKYGEQVTDSGGPGIIVARNTGTAASLPRIHVTGYPTSLSLSSGGRTVSWSGGGSQSLDIDFNTMTPTSGTILEDQVFAIRPGGSQVSVSVVPQNAQVSIITRPAWR